MNEKLSSSQAQGRRNAPPATAAMAGTRASDDDLADAIKLVRSSGALADTMERARLYARRAIDALAPFPAGRARAAMTEAVEFAVARAY